MEKLTELKSLKSLKLKSMWKISTAFLSINKQEVIFESEDNKYE